MMKSHFFFIFLGITENFHFDLMAPKHLNCILENYFFMCFSFKKSHLPYILYFSVVKASFRRNQPLSENSVDLTSHRIVQIINLYKQHRKIETTSPERFSTDKNMEIDPDELGSSGTTQTNKEPSKSPVKSRKRKATSPARVDSEDIGETESSETTTTPKNYNEEGVPVMTSKIQKMLLSSPLINLVGGKVFVMGVNTCGQLGFRLEITEKKRPVLLELQDYITSIVAGGMHSICLTESGEVITFGCNDEGALGRITANIDEEISPGRVEIPHRIVQISAGDSHSAALTESGQVYVWGNFRSGNGSMGLTADGLKEIRPIRILNNISIVKISSGENHLACLSNDGIVYTCGCGQNGKLGRLTEQECLNGGQRGLTALLEPAAVPVRALIKNIWTSNFSTFLKAQETGLIYAFGVNNCSQLGYKNETNASTHKQVNAYSAKQVVSFNRKNWKEIAGGQHHTLCLDSDSRVYSMGCENYGKLGLGKESGDKSSPTPISSLQNEKCTTIACGDDVSFAVTEEGSLYSWGNGDKYQLGHGNDEDCVVPRLVERNFAKFWKVLKVSSGGQHTIILATPKETYM